MEEYKYVETKPSIEERIMVYKIKRNMWETENPNVINHFLDLYYKKVAVAQAKHDNMS